MTDLVGQQFGNYRLLKSLGKGGFAEVYLGEHILLGTLAAIKVLKGPLSPQEEKEFINEARIIANLKHMHIIRLLEFGVEGSTPFMVMEYAPHGTLRINHPIGTPLPITSIVSYVKQIADALQYAHDGNLIHRDVKPENMLVGDKGDILLGDFGIALPIKNIHTQTTQTIIGTFLYMAPEQFKGKPLPASDQYALGCVVYEWLCGEFVYNSTGAVLIAQHLSDLPEPMRKIVPTIPAAVEQVVFKALAKDPQQRFASVTDFAAALEQASQAQQPNKPLILASSPSTPVSPVAPTQSVIPPNMGNWKSYPIGSLRFSSNTYIMPVWAPHQPYIALVDENQNVLVWEATTDKIIFNHQRPPNQRQSNQRQSGFFDWLSPRTEKQIPIPETPVKEVMSMAWAPHDPLIAITFDGNLQEVWNVFTKTKLSAYRHLDSQATKAVANSVRNTTWSPNGRYIVSTALENININHPNQYGTWERYSGYYNPYGTPPQYPAPTSIEKLVIWEALSGRQVISLNGNGVKAVWSPDEQKIACYCREHISSSTATASSSLWGHPPSAADKWLEPVVVIYEGVVDIWDLTAKGRSFSFDHPAGVIDVAWLNDSTYIASTSKKSHGPLGYTATGVGQVRFWNTTTGESIPGSSDSDFYYEPLVWTSDKTYFAALDGDGKAIQLFNLANRRTVHKFGDNTYKVFLIEWSSDMEHILTMGVPEHGLGSSNRSRYEFRLWNIASGIPIFTFEGDEGQVKLSPDGTRIATVSPGKTLQIWDVQKRKLFHTFPGLAGQQTLAWSPDGTLIATLMPSKLQIWQAA